MLAPVLVGCHWVDIAASATDRSLDIASWLDTGRVPDPPCRHVYASSASLLLRGWFGAFLCGRASYDPDDAFNSRPDSTVTRHTGEDLSIELAQHRFNKGCAARGHIAGDHWRTELFVDQLPRRRSATRRRLRLCGTRSTQWMGVPCHTLRLGPKRQRRRDRAWSDCRHRYVLLGSIRLRQLRCGIRILLPL